MNYRESWKKKQTERGLCYQCGKYPVKKGCKRCARCLSDIYRKRKKRMTQNHCRYCQKLVGKTVCDSCKEKYRLYRANRRELLKTNGTCMVCGKDRIGKSKYCKRHLLERMALMAIGSGSLWKQIDGLFQKQKGICAYTGEKLRIGENASIDHVIPIAQGGVRDIDNVVWCTLTVNMAKRDLNADQFYLLCNQVINFNRGNNVLPR